jgi:hypothetical protein
MDAHRIPFCPPHTSKNARNYTGYNIVRKIQDLAMFRSHFRQENLVEYFSKMPCVLVVSMYWAV